MPSLSRRNLGSGRLRSLGADLGCFSSLKLCGPPLKASRGGGERCGGMLHPEGILARRAIPTNPLPAPYGAPKGDIWSLS